MKPRLCIDLDDTVAQYTKHYVECLTLYPEYYPYPQSRVGFFLELEVIPGALETIEKLKEHFEIHFVTRPSIENLHCYSEKAEWVLNYFGKEGLKNLTFTSYKESFLGDYLVDDVLWEGFKGIQLQFGQPDLMLWEEVYNKLMKYITIT